MSSAAQEKGEKGDERLGDAVPLLPSSTVKEDYDDIDAITLIPSRRLKRKLIALALIVILLLWAFSYPYQGKTRISTPSEGETAGATTSKRPHEQTSSRKPLLPEYIARHAGQYSPWFSAQEYPRPPAGCIVDQVNILQRHGSRFPTYSANRYIRKMIAKLQQANLGEASGKFAFLKDYSYALGDEDLVPMGAEESRTAGRIAYERYSQLALDKGIFVRSTSSERVVDSCTNWTAGFRDASKEQVPISAPLVISDAQGSNNTLANNNCPLATFTHPEWKWAKIFTEAITERLQSELPESIAEELPLTILDVIMMMTLCPFETVALERTSDFCGLFDKEEEWRQYEYFNDLEKYYNRGPGATLGAVQGTGYVAELIARLTDSPVDDHTFTNRTLTRDKRTFPLGKGIYWDGTHDNTMAAILAALSLYSGPSLPLNHMPDDTVTSEVHNAWHISQLTPFAGRIAFERLSCARQGERIPTVRILANDKPLRLLNDEKDGLGQGMVKLETFMGEQTKFLGSTEMETDWQECGWRPA